MIYKYLGLTILNKCTYVAPDSEPLQLIGAFPMGIGLGYLIGKQARE